MQIALAKVELVGDLADVPGLLRVFHDLVPEQAQLLELRICVVLREAVGVDPVDGGLVDGVRQIRLTQVGEGILSHSEVYVAVVLAAELALTDSLAECKEKLLRTVGGEGYDAHGVHGPHAAELSVVEAVPYSSCKCRSDLPALLLTALIVHFRQACELDTDTVNRDRSGNSHLPDKAVAVEKTGVLVVEEHTVGVEDSLVHHGLDPHLLKGNVDIVDPFQVKRGEAQGLLAVGNGAVSEEIVVVVKGRDVVSHREASLLAENGQQLV